MFKASELKDLYESALRYKEFLEEEEYKEFREKVLTDTVNFCETVVQDRLYDKAIEGHNPRVVFFGACQMDRKGNQLCTPRNVKDGTEVPLDLQTWAEHCGSYGYGFYTNGEDRVVIYVPDGEE